MNNNVVMILLLLLLGGATRTQAQSQEAQQLLLNVEKLAQFKQILSDMKKGYQILSSGYNAIRDVSEGNFRLHHVFLEGLLAVSPQVRNYHKIGDILKAQLSIVKQCRTLLKQADHSGLFHPAEIDYLAKVYQRLLIESATNLDELLSVITAGKLRMSDGERLEAIDRIYDSLKGKLDFVQSFNGKNRVLALQRHARREEVRMMEQLTP